MGMAKAAQYTPEPSSSKMSLTVILLGSLILYSGCVGISGKSVKLFRKVSVELPCNLGMPEEEAGEEFSNVPSS